MHLVITDSGLGGLSVCAQLIRLLKETLVYKNKLLPIDNLKITYVNAVPSNERGYNLMSGKDEKISTFNKLIRNTNKIFSPNYIFVACGTLSVFLQELNSIKDNSCKIEGIIPIGEKLLLESLNSNPKTRIIIFGTPTTISAKTIQILLYKNGIDKKRIFTQSCPELANEISNDQNGSRVSKKIAFFVKEALEQLPSNPKEPLIAFLGCTHYAFRENFFYNSFKREGQNNLTLLNPNLASAKFIHSVVLQDQHSCKYNSMRISLEFVSPYVIPIKEENTLSQLLDSTSTETVLALKNANICPELFND